MRVIMHEIDTIQKPSVAGRFLRDLMRMPTWHRYVLLAAISVAVIGTIGRVRQFFGVSPSPSQALASPRSNFTSDDTTADADSTEVSPQPWYLSPRFLTIGGSVLGGFLIGWAMRVFVKTTILIGLAITAVLGSLSYFHILNVDLTSVQQHYQGDVNWLGEQASRLKNVAISHIPSHAGGLLGIFMGFRRPRL
jgi:uncharacterized membrane protein (Fun14 family)